MYVAIEKGYFQDYNIDIDLILTSGADKVTAALLSNDAQIGLCGAEATIYVYNQGEKDYLQTFSQLTQKDGTYIVSRKKIKNFKLDDLKGKTIIGGRAAGMPEMTLEYALLQNGIDPRKDVNIDTSIAFPAMSGTFIGGYGDFVTLFEPTASAVEKEGYGHVVEGVGDLGGIVPTENLILMMGSQVVVKTLVEVVILPMTIRFVKWLKRTEGMDVYDNDINYSII